MNKQAYRNTITSFLSIPNVGPATVEDFKVIGISAPAELIGKDPYAMYDSLCQCTQQSHDPCVIDVFISAVRYMEGGPAKKWWQFTAERKLALAKT